MGYTAKLLRVDLTKENMELASKELLDIKEESKSVVVADETTNIIAITNTEERFKNEEIERIFEQTGAKIKFNGKGAESRDGFLDSLEESKGKTTLVLLGHGSSEKFGISGSDFSDEQLSFISYNELGDSLIKRAENTGESLENINIVISACYSNDFKENVYSYLNSVYDSSDGFEGYPNIITSTKRNQVGYGFYKKVFGSWYSPFNKALYETNERDSNSALTLDDFYRMSDYEDKIGQFLTFESSLLTLI